MVTFAVLACFLAADAAAAPWTLLRDDPRLMIWERPVAHSDVHEVKVEAVIDAPAARIWQVVRDTPSFKDFLPHVLESRVIVDQGYENRVIYQRINPPFVSDRDYVVRQHAKVDTQTGVVQQDFAAATDVGPPPVQGVVRITTLHGKWVLEPVSPKQTRLVYWIYADPGGSIPAWIVNFGQRFTLPRLFAAIEARAQMPEERSEK